MNGEKYYTITYANAYKITSETNFYKKFKVLEGYVKVADTTKEKITISGFKSLFSNYPENMTNLSTTTRYVVLDNLVSYLSSTRFDDFEYPNHFMFIEKGTILIAFDTFTINGQTDYARNYGLLQRIIPATSIKKVKTPTKVYTAAERKIVYKTTKDTFSRESFGKQFLTEDHKLNKIKAGTQLQVLKEVTADGKNYVFIKVK